MTPQFTTPCYVRIEDADKRKEVCQNLKDIGYNLLGMHHVWPVLYVDEGELVGREDEFLLDCTMPPATDCGTNIDLFLALASMRSDTNEGQWFIAQANIMFKKLKGEVVTASKKRYITIGEMFMPLTHNLRFTWFGGNSKQLFRRATPAEIIEHFNNKTK